MTEQTIRWRPWVILFFPIWALLAAACGGVGASSRSSKSGPGSSGDEDPNQPASLSADAALSTTGEDASEGSTENKGGQEAITGSSTLNTQGETLPARPKMKSGAQALYEDGYRDIEKGKYESAQQKFSAALREDPRAYGAVYALGVLADRQGQESKALELYGESLRQQPDYELAAQGIASIYARRGQPAEAVRILEPLAKRWQRNLALQSVFANALLAADKEDEAIAHAKSILRRDERYTPAMMVLVKANLKKGRRELAQSIIDQVLKINGKNSEARFYHGNMLRADQRLSEAMAEYRKAVELRPDFAEARMALGVQLLSGGNYSEALENLEICAKLVPNSVAASINLGDGYRATKRWSDAKKAFDRALQLEPRLPEAHFNLGLLYLEAQENFPGMDKMAALNASVAEFNAYRELKGPRISKQDPSGEYLADLARSIEREKKRIEKEKARKEREAARKAKEAAREAAKAEQAKNAPASEQSPSTDLPSSKEENVKQSNVVESNKDPNNGTDKSKVAK